MNKTKVDTKEKVKVSKIKKIIKLIALFLVPGVLVAIAYAFLASPILKIEFPSIVILGLAALTVLVPVEMGIILFQSKRELGVFSIKKMITYQNSLPIKKYLLIVPIILFWSIIVMVLGKGVNEFIKDSFFSWLPDWYIFSADYSGYGISKIVMAFVFAFLVGGIILPIVEEIYFRGYLLPRMEWMGKFAPVLNAFLFALYHFWTPWQIITRTVALIPFCYVAYKTKNIKVVIIIHCLLNIMGDAVGILLLM
ncbi:MAG: CPBP family intramembrane metalloprotease [Firmicutes bacterium]|nr:CPBP family intramembrane metalloprotease [Bacillota bacterium]